ncbi:MAG: division plane positioning ATPase MipZ [Rhodospirillaceae bacterium]
MTATIVGPGGARTIVIGNQKGGSGKSTIATHLIVGLARTGLRIGSVDLDGAQGTLTRYLENRASFASKRDLALPTSDHVKLVPSGDDMRDRRELEQCLEAFRDQVDVVVIDTPGADTPTARVAHGEADILITPLNDSFIDLDVIARIDGETMAVVGPSTYAARVWEAKQAKAKRDGVSMKWILLRNRLSHLDARNKRDMEESLDELSKRLGFRIIPGLGERVIYRELFLNGLTLIDLRDGDDEMGMKTSHIAARRELRELMDAIGLKVVA